MVLATGVGAETQLAQMAALVTGAQASEKPPVQRLADRMWRSSFPSLWWSRQRRG